MLQLLYEGVEVDRYSISLEGVESSEYGRFLVEVLSARNRDIELYLGRRILEIRRSEPRIRRALGRDDVFRVVAYVLGSDISMKSPSGIAMPLRIVTNPSIAIEGDTVHLYLRLSTLGSHPIPNPWSRTFIGYAELDRGRLSGRLRLRAVPVLYPYLTIERVEDPRIYLENLELYHVRAFELYRPIACAKSFTTTFVAKLSSPSRATSLELVRFRWVDGEEHLIRSYRDTFPLNEKYMIVRPWIEELELGAIGVAPREGSVIEVSEVRFYPELAPIENERKTGSNCIAKLSSNEYLLVFHGVDKLLGYYHTYAAILSSDGELLAVTPRPILSPRIHDYFGARPATVFVCGAQIDRDRLILSAGKDDEITLILETELDRVIEKMKFVSG